MNHCNISFQPWTTFTKDAPCTEEKCVEKNFYVVSERNEQNNLSRFMTYFYHIYFRISTSKPDKTVRSVSCRKKAVLLAPLPNQLFNGILD